MILLGNVSRYLPILYVRYDQRGLRIVFLVRYEEYVEVLAISESVGGLLAKEQRNCGLHTNQRHFAEANINGIIAQIKRSLCSIRPRDTR